MPARVVSTVAVGRDRATSALGVASAVVLCVIAALATEVHARGRPIVGPPLVHCTEKGETPQHIARRYGVRLKDLVRGSGTLQRLQADNRKRKRKNEIAKVRAQSRHHAALKRWKLAPRRKRGPRPKLKFSPLSPQVLGLHEPVRVMRPTRLHEVRDAVLRLHRGARVAWVAKTFGVPECIVRCVNMLKPRAQGVGCKRSKAPGKRRRGVPRFRYRCDGGRNALLVRLSIPKSRGRSTGRPTGGSLRHGEAMPRVPGIIVKQKQHGFGTTHLVSRLIDAVGQVHKRYAETPDLVVGDLSRQRGGRLNPHKSHQNGLDADIGYYHLDPVPTDRFTLATAKNLDLGRTWTLVKRLLESGEVQYIFMSTSIQQLLRAYVLKRRRVDGAWCLRLVRALSARRYGSLGKSRRPRASGWERCVLRTFGYRGHTNALIRHAGGHDDHLHVRFFPHGRRARGSGAP